MAAPASPPMLLDCTGLDVTVAGRCLVRGLQLSIGPGDFVALLGRNGTGKSLSLLTLAGLRRPAAGTVRLAGRPLEDLPRTAIARQLGMLLQEQTDPFPTTVLETALLGRHAQTGLWHWESARDLELARTALEAMDLGPMESRAAATLSGGERQRLAMATLLAQDPQLLLLDEPMNHLDPQHRFLVLDCLARLCAGGRAVLASLHDPMLAARYATHALLLHGDGRWDCGSAREILTPGNLEMLYHTPFTALAHEQRLLLFPVPPQP